MANNDYPYLAVKAPIMGGLMYVGQNLSVGELIDHGRRILSSSGMRYVVVHESPFRAYKLYPTGVILTCYKFENSSSLYVKEEYDSMVYGQRQYQSASNEEGYEDDPDDQWDEDEEDDEGAVFLPKPRGHAAGLGEWDSDSELEISDAEASDISNSTEGVGGTVQVRSSKEQEMLSAFISALNSGVAFTDMDIELQRWWLDRQ